MVFPLGEWLLLSVGFLAWAKEPFFRIDKSLRMIPLVWALGWIVEHSLVLSPPWDWHFPRIFVLIALAIMAWGKAGQRKVSSILLASMCLVVQDLFLLNEPGIFAYDKWLFAIIFVSVAFFSASNLWNMVLALSAGMLLSMLFTVFLYDGVVRYYNLPNSFLWHFSIVACLVIAALRQVYIYYKARKDLGLTEEANDESPRAIKSSMDTTNPQWEATPPLKEVSFNVYRKDD